MNTFPTPEEAARAFIGDPSPRFVGAVVRGDVAVVAHWVKGPGGGDTETTTCYRDGDGWEAGDTGNGNGSALSTATDRVTAVYWDRAPEGAVAGRFAADGREEVVQVEDGFFIVVFDDLPYQQPNWDEGPAGTNTEGWTGLGRRTDWTPDEARAWMTSRSGFDFPELVEWIFRDDAVEA